MGSSTGCESGGGLADAGGASPDTPGDSLSGSHKTSTKIGPSHIRELAGAMEEKKAGWGILVTTSSFTAGSEQKAREHGRMQLISGDELCWLIKERTGKEVLIG